MYEDTMPLTSDLIMLNVNPTAPSDEIATDYDRKQLALYAALLDAEEAGQSWRDVASNLFGLAPDQPGAEACWRSHLERARWIVGEGLATALVAFNARMTQ